MHNNRCVVSMYLAEMKYVNIKTSIIVGFFFLNSFSPALKSFFSLFSKYRIIEMWFDPDAFKKKLKPLFL